MIGSLSNPSALTTSLQEKLDAAVQSPHTFSKLAEKNSGVGISNNGGMPSPSINNSRVAQRDVVSNSSDQSVGSVDGKTNYRDYSRYHPDEKDAAALMNQTSTTKEPTFPVKLHKILSSPEFQDIISWLPHGRSWRILQQKAFEERVIPLYFRHGRYSSFARQVNGWGFRRVTHGSDYNSYYHEMFLRGMPHLCDKMRRLTSKDAAARKKTEDEPAPDFYTISRNYPLPDSAAPAPIKSAVTPPPNPNLAPSTMLPTGLLGGGAGAQTGAAQLPVGAAAAGIAAGNIGNPTSQAIAANLGFANQLSALQGLNAGALGGVPNMFSPQDLFSANLGTNLGAANLGAANIGANFSAANFGANLGAAGLGANLNLGANLSAANLSAANLGANLGGTNLGANFSAANLGANLGANVSAGNSMSMFGGQTGNGLEDVMASSNNLTQLLAANPAMLSELLRAQTTQSQTPDLAQLLGMNQ